jgi:hypothetical protein
MKKLNKHLPNKTSRKLALETSTLKQLSGEQLATAQGGATHSQGCGITDICGTSL